VGLYKFRADYQAAHFWASDEVIADLSKDVYLQTGGGTLAVTVRSGDATVLTGAPCYLFTATGTYLGQKSTTDENGLVAFDVADGSYKIRVDYLGYQYWSESITALETLAASMLIAHQDVAVQITKSDALATGALPAVRCYLFTAAGAYTGISSESDQTGIAHFTVPLNGYKVRADYLGRQYWSEEFHWLDTVIDIPHGEISLTVTKAGTAVAGSKVYLFNDGGSYLGINGTTATDGTLSFTVPAAAYKLRIDLNGNQYWTDVVNVIEYQDNPLEVAIGDLAANLTNDPHPLRRDGRPPLYTPLLAATEIPFGVLSESAAQITVGTEARAYWYISDHLGTAQLITDETGSVVWQGEYAPFGEVDVVLNELDNRFRFPGQILDPESRLYYNWHRFYDPETGRYISADPIGLDGGINLYAYVENNPVNWFDLMGLTRACPLRKEGIQAETQYWRPYPGDSKQYHCGFDGYLEVREDECDDSAVAECFYDCSGTLVDETHPYKGCRGTPDEYPVPRDWWNHLDIVHDHMTKDKGGPNGPSDVADNLGDEAYQESRRYFRENPTYTGGTGRNRTRIR
jgi:RHS repeat-associated protein